MGRTCSAPSGQLRPRRGTGRLSKPRPGAWQGGNTDENTISNASDQGQDLCNPCDSLRIAACRFPAGAVPEAPPHGDPYAVWREVPGSRLATEGRDRDNRPVSLDMQCHVAQSVRKPLE